MPVVFKYKHPCSYEYAPGYVNIGVDGEQGYQGPHGNAVYFTDFELNNSYEIELALQKIENNYILSNSNINQLQGRVYKVNDIILSNNGNCYKLIESSAKSLFKNYKFDIQFLGKMHKSSFNNAAQLVAYDFTNSKIYDNNGALLREFPSHTYSAVPTNRVEKDFDSSFYQMSHNDKSNMDEYFSLYGTWLKFVVYGNAQDSIYYNDKTNFLGGVKYSLEIQLNNVKTLQGISSPVDASGNTKNDNGDPIGVHDNGADALLETKVPMEFSNICICNHNVETKSYGSEETDIDKNTELVLSELILPNIDKPVHLPAYISDYSMDMLHPSGNNIKCTLNNDMSMWYKSGKNHWPGKTAHLGYNSYVRIDDEIRGTYNETFPKNEDPDFDYSKAENPKGVVCEDTLNFYKNMHTVMIGSKDYEEKLVSVDSFDDYSAGLGMSAMNTDEIQSMLNVGKLFEDDHNFIISSGDKHHAGESMFFSSKSGEDVPAAIMTYLFSDSNKFILTSKDHRTRECITTELSVTVNNDFKDADIILTKENDKITKIKVVKH